MKRAKPFLVPFEGTLDQAFEPVVVAMDSSTEGAVLYVVEWRDGAGELHHADLRFGADGKSLPIEETAAAPKT